LRVCKYRKRTFTVTVQKIDHVIRERTQNETNKYEGKLTEVNVLVVDNFIIRWKDA